MAIEWESKGKNTSFVLRGDDLRAAHKWLTEAGADKERQPTSLQTDYIIASRKAAARRQRITLGAVSFGAVVAVVLAILALIQRGEARKQEGIAKDNAAEATRQKDAALETLSQSDFAQGTRLIADQRPAQALAYLARAVRSNGNPAAATRIGSLLIERVWPLPIESPHADAVKTFFSPTGTHAVVVLADRSAEIRENATARPLSPRIRLEAGVDVACFSPDGARVVLAGDSWKEGEPNEPVPLAIQLWETNRGRAIAEPARFEDSAGEETLVFSPDSRFLAITGVGEKMLVWDAQTGRELRRLERGGVPQFSRDGERVAIRAPASADNGEAAQVFETRTGKTIGAAIESYADQAEGLGSTLGGIALSPDGLRIAAAFNSAGGEGYGGSERVLEVATGKPVTPPMEHQSWVERLEFSPGGQWLLALGHAEARVWDARTGQPVTDWLKNPGADGAHRRDVQPGRAARGDDLGRKRLCLGSRNPREDAAIARDRRRDDSAVQQRRPALDRRRRKRSFAPRLGPHGRLGAAALASGKYARPARFHAGNFRVRPLPRLGHPLGEDSARVSARSADTGRGRRACEREFQR